MFLWFFYVLVTSFMFSIRFYVFYVSGSLDGLAGLRSFSKGGLKSRLGVGTVWLVEPHLRQLLLDVVGGNEKVKVVGGVFDKRWSRWPQPPHPTPDRAFTDPPTRPPAHTHTFPQYP